MTPYFQCMKLVPSSWLRPRTILDQTTSVTLSTPRVNKEKLIKLGTATGIRESWIRKVSITLIV